MQAQDAASMTLFERLRASSHPIATLVYIALRLSPIGLYLFGGIVSSNFTLLFVTCSLLLAADFWNVKNVTGRRLVGLRWWNETTAEGQSLWVYETADPSAIINPIDSQCFWIFLYAVPVAWIVLGVMAILRLHLLWLVLVFFALMLTVTNALAFRRCDKFRQSGSQVGNVQASIAANVVSSAWANLTSRFRRSQ